MCGALPEPRAARLCWVHDPIDGSPVDHALAMRFPGPRSFTGEDVAELHVHGSPAVVKAILSILGRADGCRLAEPGEFTKRALLNGKMDLTQAEGLGDLLAAETEVQLRHALGTMEGRLSRTVESWRDELLEIVALLEVTIDFSDEELPDDILEPVGPSLERLKEEMIGLLEGSKAAERVRSGFEVAIVGVPNSGKSTLLNWLAGREAALTSEHAGTTRDVIEVHMDVAGLPVTFLDTAGLRCADNVVERLGIDRARSRAERADLRIFLDDGSADPTKLGVAKGLQDLVVRAKSDLNCPSEDGVSGRTGAGVAKLLEVVAGILSGKVSGASLIAHERQRTLVASSKACIERAFLLLSDVQVGPEVIAENLRMAIRDLEILVGKSDIEAVLDVIFANFCLGK